MWQRNFFISLCIRERLWGEGGEEGEDEDEKERKGKKEKEEKREERRQVTPEQAPPSPRYFCHPVL